MDETAVMTKQITSTHIELKQERSLKYEEVDGLENPFQKVLVI